MGMVNIATDLQITLNKSRWKHQHPKHSILMHDPGILRLLYNTIFFRSEQKLYNTTCWNEVLVSTLEMQFVWF